MRATGHGRALIFHTCALGTNGTLWCCGSDTYGQLGDGGSGLGNVKTTPMQLGALTTWFKVALGTMRMTPRATPTSAF